MNAISTVCERLSTKSTIPQVLHKLITTKPPLSNDIHENQDAMAIFHIQMGQLLHAALLSAKALNVKPGEVISEKQAFAPIILALNELFLSDEGWVKLTILEKNLQFFRCDSMIDRSSTMLIEEEIEGEMADLVKKPLLLRRVVLSHLHYLKLIRQHAFNTLVTTQQSLSDTIQQLTTPKLDDRSLCYHALVLLSQNTPTSMMSAIIGELDDRQKLQLNDVMTAHFMMEMTETITQLDPKKHTWLDQLSSWRTTLRNMVLESDASSTLPFQLWLSPRTGNDCQMETSEVLLKDKLTIHSTIAALLHYGRRRQPQTPERKVPDGTTAQTPQRSESAMFPPGTTRRKLPETPPDTQTRAVNASEAK